MRKYYGIIVTSNVASGPASTLTYTARIQMDGAVVEYSNIKPATNRPPDDIDTRAAAPGTWFEYVEVQPNQFVALFQEFPDFAECA